MTYLKAIIDNTPVVITNNQYKNKDWMEHIKETFEKADFNLLEITSLFNLLKDVQNTYSTVVALQLSNTENPQVDKLKKQFKMEREELEKKVGELYATNIVFSVYFKEHLKDFGGVLPRFDDSLETMNANLTRIKEGIRKNLPYKIKGTNIKGTYTYRQFVDPFALINTVIHIYPSYEVQFDTSFSDFVIRNEAIPLEETQSV